MNTSVSVSLRKNSNGYAADHLPDAPSHAIEWTSIFKDQEAPEKEVDIDLIIPPAPKLSNRVIECENISYKICDRTLFKNLDFKLEGGERIGVVGKNGMGKSTLLKTILGQLEPATGKVMIGS